MAVNVLKVYSGNSNPGTVIQSSKNPSIAFYFIDVTNPVNSNYEISGALALHITSTVLSGLTLSTIDYGIKEIEVPYNIVDTQMLIAVPDNIRLTNMETRLLLSAQDAFLLDVYAVQIT